MIGIFDSGLGGLTVVREIQRQMPGYPVVYLGDTARMPYGNKSPRAVAEFAVQDARFLMAQGAKVIVIACNTASAVAHDAVRRAVKVPVFEVVSPAVRAAAAITAGRIGVIGTRATIGSGVYEKRLKIAAPKAKVFGQACPLFVPLVEEGWLDQPETLAIAKRYLLPLKLRKIDALILGCTHYPFLKPIVQRAIGPNTRLVDPARETVATLKRYLESKPALLKELHAAGRRGVRDRYFVSDVTPNYRLLASRWLGRDIRLKETHLPCS
ncbi:MAG: glutamate racemase [Patescibacteria group bacterium]|nr:glutamate racemase [Patescibacteria group bacterium]